METLSQIKDKLNLKSAEISSANIINVSTGTTGYKGGNSSHGGRTLFEIKNITNTDMRVSINGSDLQDVEEVTIVFGGDCELDTFKDALLFGYRTLEEMEPEISLWERIKLAWKYQDLGWLKKS